MNKGIIIRFFVVIFTASAFLFAFSRQVLAVTAPSFPSCVNPQGTITTNFSSGTHAVPGNPNSFQGTDTIFTVTQDTVLQCLCPSDGNGIQTNWWKIPELSQAEIQSFTQQGWIFVPDGAAWGLQPVPYLAQNISFSCLGNAGGAGGSSSPGGQGGGVLGVTTLGEVLGLASTGNILFIYFVTIVGVSSLLVGVILRALRFGSKK